MYVIINLKTLAQLGGIHESIKGAERAYKLGLETYAITTDYVICRVVPVKHKTIHSEFAEDEAKKGVRP